MPVVHTEITGFAHLDQHEQKRYSTLAKRMTLDLRREPHNPHDPNAIRVTQDGVLIGYIPRRDNRDIAEAIDAGHLVRCVCTNNAIIDNIRCIAQAKIVASWD